jgi:uncharacterized protein YdeI (BOF family)
MKQIILFLIVSIFVLTSCNNTRSQAQQSEQTNNEQITILKATELAAAMETTDELQVKLSGTIVEVCQHSGCWMDIDMGNDQRVLVTFPEEVFVTPKDAVGKQAIVNGTATKVIIPVKRLQLQAADEGSSEEEINAINEPLTEFSIEATKVEIK